MLHFSDDEVTIGRFYATYLIQDFYRKVRSRRQAAKKISSKGGLKLQSLKDVVSLQVSVSFCTNSIS